MSKPKECSKNEIENMCKSVQNMAETVINKYPDSTEEIKELKVKLAKATLAEDAIKIITKIITLQLKYMKKYP